MTISPVSTMTEIIRTQSCLNIIQTMPKSPGTLYSLNLQACDTLHCLQNNEKLWFLKYAPTAITRVLRWILGGRHEIDGAGRRGRPRANAGWNKSILEISEGDRRGERSGRRRELRQGEKEGTPPSSVLLDRWWWCRITSDRYICNLCAVPPGLLVTNTKCAPERYHLCAAYHSSSYITARFTVAYQRLLQYCTEPHS